jgi:AraC family transcriptional regulator
MFKIFIRKIYMANPLPLSPPSPYDLLDIILINIEKNLKSVNKNDFFVSKLNYSSIHLNRLFKFAFNKTMGNYIRSRKLSESINDLLTSDLSVCDISMEYGYGYEQNYIRSFKREFGITPGDFRKSKNILKITPPLHLFDADKLENGIVFGPEIVVVPKMFLAGKNHILPWDNSINTAPEAAKQFWAKDRSKLSNVINDSVYIGFTTFPGSGLTYTNYLTSVQVSSFDNVPNGFDRLTFETALCARFHYVWKHHYNDINRDTAEGMYNAIRKFHADGYGKYRLNPSLFFERIDTNAYDGTYCQMEWFAKVME